MKKRKYILYFFLLLFTLFTSRTFAQEKNKTYSKPRVMGETFMLRHDYSKAVNAFERHEEKKNVVLDESYYKYKSLALYRLGRFDEAVETYSKAQNIPGEAIDSVYFKGLINRSSLQDSFGDDLKINRKPDEKLNMFVQELFEVQPVHILNSEFSEFAALEHDSILYFSTNRNKDFRKFDTNTGVSYYDVYSVPLKSVKNSISFGKTNYQDLNRKQKSEITKEIKETDIIPYSRVNTVYNDGPVCFYRDSILYITRNEPFQRGKNIDFYLNIYQSDLKNLQGEESFKPSSFHLGSTRQSIGHITFSPEGDRACFSIKKSNDESNADLYFSNYKNKSWSPPTNAGTLINTNGDELFPFWSDDGYIYFSSDGFQGAGGLDVYRFDPDEVGAEPVNIGYTVNSEFDDFSFSINSEGVGYFSSNREGGQGSDDLYKIDLKTGTIVVHLVCSPLHVLDPWFQLRGTDDQEFDPFNLRKELEVTFPNLPYGKYKLHHLLETDSVYASVPLYMDTAHVYVDFPDPVDTITVRFSNFQFDDYSLSEVNQENFQKLVAFLKNNHDVQILLKGHTDKFGTKKYNQKLGMKRSTAMEQFLREQGVKNYIEKESYGRENTVSEFDHRLNRRVDVELRVPGSPNILEFVPRGDRGQQVDLQISYDNPRKFDIPIMPGYYIRVASMKRYKKPHEVAAEKKLPRSLKLMLYSENNFIFRYFIRMPFATKEEAVDYAKNELKLKDYLIQKFD